MTDEPRGWQLDWAPLRRVGAPRRLPPTDVAIYAEFPVRAIAFTLDVVAGLVLGQLASQVLGLLAGWWSRQTDGQAQEAALLAASTGHLVVSVAVTLGVVYLWRTFRASPGQMALRLYVVQRGTGRRLTRRASFTRWMLVYLPLALVMSSPTLGTMLVRVPATADIDPFLVTGAALLLPLAWWAVLALSVGFDQRRGRGLHDQLAGSVVVRRVD